MVLLSGSVNSWDIKTLALIVRSTGHVTTVIIVPQIVLIYNSNFFLLKEYEKFVENY